MADPADNITRSVQADDEDDWEYEYSATECETYYLTLDLPVRDFHRGPDDVVHNTRGGYRVWYNPSFDGPDDVGADQFIARGGGAAHGVKESVENEDLDEVDMGAEKTTGGGGGAQQAMREQRTVSHQTHQTQEAEAAASSEPELIQILELHSEHPLISYRGAVFRGTWAENVGTELLFAPREPHGGLPALRNFPEDLDLLAASASRVGFSQVDLKPMQDQQSSEIELQPKRYREDGAVYVHVHSDKFGERRPQADFLEDLTKLKRKRGETDEVTIATTETPHNHLLDHDPGEETYRNRVERGRVRRLRLKEEAMENEGATRQGSEGGARPGKRTRWAKTPEHGSITASRSGEMDDTTPGGGGER